jgi:monoterpene epsilon-lactone hydrolase
MSQHERPIDRLVAALRSDPIDLAGDLQEVRSRFARLGSQGIVPGEAKEYCTEIAGLPVLDLPGRAEGVVVFLHAGGYIAGSATSSFALSRRLAEITGRRVVSVDYRLAPEHPFPAARDDVLAVHRALVEETSRVAFVAASAGGGIALHALMEIRDRGEPLPRAVSLLSPFTDLTQRGSSYEWNSSIDPSLTLAGLAAGARAYAAPHPADLRPSPTNLRGIPPIQIQAGSREILLSDALDLAAAAAGADVHTALEVWPEMVHVFPTFAGVLDEGIAALRRIGAFLDDWMPG